MSGKKAENGDVSSEFYDSSEYCDPTKLIRLVATDPSLNIKARIWKAAMRLGFNYRRARSIWYGEARVDFIEMDRLREIAAPEWLAEQKRQARALAHEAARATWRDPMTRPKT